METLLPFLRAHCAKLALPDMGSLLQEFFYKLKRKKHEPLGSWCTRYRNAYTKIRQALARRQRAESADDTQAPHSDFSPQGDQPWNWSERGTEEVMECDDSSDASSKNVVRLELEFLEDKLGQLMKCNTNAAY